MSTSKIAAVIPARSGSKRLPGKNTMLLGGRSLFDRAIDCATESALVDEIIATTDDAALLEKANENRATLLPRPASLCTDSASTVDVIIHAIQTVGEIDIVVLLQPTSPFRQAADIDRCVDKLLSDDSIPSVVTGCETDHPVEWTFRTEGDALEPTMGWEPFSLRSQDLPPRARLNGAVYAVRTDYLLRERRLVGPGSRLVLMPQVRSVDIDTAADFAIAETLLSSGVTE